MLEIPNPDFNTSQVPNTNPNETSQPKTPLNPNPIRILFPYTPKKALIFTPNPRKTKNTLQKGTMWNSRPWQWSNATTHHSVVDDSTIVWPLETSVLNWTTHPARREFRWTRIQSSSPFPVIFPWVFCFGHSWETREHLGWWVVWGWFPMKNYTKSIPKCSKFQKFRWISLRNLWGEQIIPSLKLTWSRKIGLPKKKVFQPWWKKSCTTWHP